MNKNYFEILRAGINTTFQDLGRKNLYHIGIPFSGAMDSRNYLLANKLVGNQLEFPVLEFAYQGPLLKYSGEKINIAITGNVNFSIKRNNKIINGNCYQTFILENGESIKKNIEEFLKNKKTILFGLPGAYSSVCSAKFP